MERSASRPRVGVSSCLLGQPVRYDGGHKRDRFLYDVLSRFVVLVPRCPEVSIGLGVPREPIQLVQREGSIEAEGMRSGIQVGAALRGYARAQTRDVRDLCGYIFKSASPSCGLQGIAVRPEAGGDAETDGRGVYAQEITAALPWVPVAEEGDLEDIPRLDGFLVRVFTLHRLQEAVADPSGRSLEAFHNNHRLLLLAHDIAACNRLDRLVERAQAGEPPSELAAAYRDEVMAALRRPPEIGRHVNLLVHLLELLHGRVEQGDQVHLRREIEAFGDGRLPWTAVRAMLRRHFRNHPHLFGSRRLYLEPYPGELTPGAKTRK